MQISILQVKNIQKQFVYDKQIFDVLKNITYKFDQNVSYAITGASGTGKSTFIHILSGIENPTSGEILFNDQNINKLSTRDKEFFLNKNVGLVFQESFLIKELTVIENIMIKGLIQNEDYNVCKDRAMNLLKSINLQEKANSSPMILSGGQKQRVSILRAIFNNPKFLLADEPTGNLDEKTANEIVDFLLQSAQEWNMGLIISTHDVNLQKKVNLILNLENGFLK